VFQGFGFGSILEGGFLEFASTFCGMVAWFLPLNSFGDVESGKSSLEQIALLGFFYMAYVDCGRRKRLVPFSFMAYLHGQNSCVSLVFH
jgi:hypothetical protein